MYEPVNVKASHFEVSFFLPLFFKTHIYYRDFTHNTADVYIRDSVKFNYIEISLIRRIT